MSLLNDRVCHDEFEITLELPPSVNKLYTKNKWGGVSLTAKARSFRERVKKQMNQHLGHLSRFPVTADRVYLFRIILFFEALENPGWFERWEKDTFVTRGKSKGELKGKRGERKAKTRYKKIDYDNRVKFIQDCVVEAVGIPDDSQIFRGEQEKREDPDNPRAEVLIRVLDSDDFIKERR